MNYKPYKPLPPFKGMVIQNFPFIEDDFDAITNYQLLCKVVEYLKNVIDNENIMEENINNLYNAFIELKTYVDNYFDNLDVQEEINNKLDEMVEDGTLETIIQQFLSSNALWCFDTVNDMIEATNLINGSYVRTLGYYSINDGGGSLYYIRNITESDEEDNGSIIFINNTLLAELIIINDTINIKQYGLTNDNFSTILNYLLLNRNENIYIPKGNYVLQNTINIVNDFTRLVCDGNLSCNSDIPFFNITGEYCNISFNGSITGTLNNDEYTGTAIRIGSDIKSVGHNIINVNKVNRVKNGFLFNPNSNNGCHYNKITFNYVQATYGIHFKAGDDDKPWINENTFYGGRLLGGTGILTEKGEHQTDRYNGNKFINIGYERLDCAIELHYDFYNIFDRCRMSESLQGEYWIKCYENAFNNTFTLESALGYDTIYDISTGSNNKNIYNVNVYDDGGNWLGNKMYASQGYFIIPKENCLQADRLIINAYDKADDYNITTDHIPVYTEEATLLIGNSNSNKTLNYIIPAEVFNHKKIRKINICVGYRTSNSTINIYDSNNNLLVSDTQLGTGTLNRKWFTLEWLYIPFGNYNSWRLTELTTSAS